MLKRKEDLVALFEEARSEFPEQFMNDILKATGRGGTFAARDYVRALRLIACLRHENISTEDIATLQKYEDAKKFIHPAVWFRHSYDSVNLAARFDQLKEPEQRAILESEDWLASEKEDGFRVWLIAYNRPGHRPGVWMFSRNYSDVDCSLCEYWDHVYQTISVPDNTIFVADCECVYTGDVNILSNYGLVAETQLQAVTSMAQMNAPQSLVFRSSIFLTQVSISLRSSLSTLCILTVKILY